MREKPEAEEVQSRKLALELLKTLHTDRLTPLFEKIKDTDKRERLEKVAKEMTQVATEILDSVGTVKGMPRGFSQTWQGKAIPLLHVAMRDGQPSGMRSQPGYKLSTPETYLRDAKRFFDTGIFPAQQETPPRRSAHRQNGPSADPFGDMFHRTHQHPGQSAEDIARAFRAAQAAREARAQQNAAAAEESRRQYEENTRRQREAEARAQAEAQRQKEESDRLQAQVQVLEKELDAALRKAGLDKDNWNDKPRTHTFEFPSWGGLFTLKERHQVLRATIPVIQEFNKKAVSIHTLSFLPSADGKQVEWSGSNVYIPKSFYESVDQQQELRNAVVRHINSQKERLFVKSTSALLWKRRAFTQLNPNTLAELRGHGLPYIEMQDIPEKADIRLSIYVVADIPRCVGKNVEAGSKLLIVGNAESDEVTYGKLAGEEAKTLRIALSKESISILGHASSDDVNTLAREIQARIRKATPASSTK